MAFTLQRFAKHPALPCLAPPFGFIGGTFHSKREFPPETPISNLKWIFFFTFQPSQSTFPRLSHGCQYRLSSLLPSNSEPPFFFPITQKTENGDSPSRFPLIGLRRLLSFFSVAAKQRQQFSTAIFPECNGTSLFSKPLRFASTARRPPSPFSLWQTPCTHFLPVPPSNFFLFHGEVGYIKPPLRRSFRLMRFVKAGSKFFLPLRDRPPPHPSFPLIQVPRNPTPLFRVCIRLDIRCLGLGWF